MNQKILYGVIGTGIFVGGYLTGRKVEKVSHNRKTKYGGTLQFVNGDDGNPGLYLSLDVTPEELIKLEDVIFKVGKPK